MPNPVVHFEVVSKDPDSLRTFFQRAFDWSIDEQPSSRGTRMMGPDDVPNGPTIGLFRDPQGHVIGLVQMEM
ncbi:MAG: VOC family protein [Vulcanimicrobiaceae bacterium]